MQLHRFDLQLFDGEQPEQVPGPVEGSPPAEPAVPPSVAQEAQNTVPASTPFTEPTGDTFSAEGLKAFLEQQAKGGTATQAPPAEAQTQPSDGQAQQAPAQAQADAAQQQPQPQQAQATPPAAQAPSQQQPVVEIPPDLLTTLGQLAMRALPQPEAKAPPIPDPVLPELPEPPDILKGTKEELDARYMEDPVAFNRALLQHELATRQVQAERERITAEHKARVAHYEMQQSFQAAFTEQVVKLGQDVFNQRADIAQEFIKAHPELIAPGSRVPAKTVVEMAFQYAEAKTAPAPVTVDINKLTPEQKKTLKDALRQEIITEYLASRTQPGAAPPVTINASIPAGKTSLTPPQMPRDLDEAQRQFLAARGVPKR